MFRPRPGLFVLFSDNFYQQDGNALCGVVCVFSLKNPSYPEYLCQSGSGITAVDIHPGKRTFINDVTNLVAML